SVSFSVWLCARAIMRLRQVTIAPTGTSSISRAFCASFKASRIKYSSLYNSIDLPHPDVLHHLLRYILPLRAVSATAAEGENQRTMRFDEVLNIVVSQNGFSVRRIVAGTIDTRLKLKENKRLSVLFPDALIDHGHTVEHTGHRSLEKAGGERDVGVRPLRCRYV